VNRFFTEDSLVARLLSLLQKLLSSDLCGVDIDPAKLTSNGLDGLALGFVDEENGKDTVSQTNAAKDQEDIASHGSLKSRVDEANDEVEELGKVNMLVSTIQEL
jgi:hypothetical protein